MHPILQNEIKDETDEEQIAKRNNTRVSQEERDKTKSAERSKTVNWPESSASIMRIYDAKET